MKKTSRNNERPRELVTEDNSTPSSNLSFWSISMNTMDNNCDSSLEYTPSIDKEDHLEFHPPFQNGQWIHIVRSNRMLQIIFLICSTGIVFIVVFYISLSILDSIFKDQLVHTNGNINMNMNGKDSISLFTSSPNSFPSYHPTSSIYLNSFRNVKNHKPSILPSYAPVHRNSVSPSFKQTYKVSSFPSFIPTQTPSILPSLIPTQTPSILPSLTQSFEPSFSPTNKPSIQHSILPSIPNSLSPSTSTSLIPSLFFSIFPSTSLSEYPSEQMSSSPTINLSNEPINFSSLIPSFLFSVMPSYIPTHQPSSSSSNIPSFTPTMTLSSMPTIHPTLLPSSSSSEHPSINPSSSYSPTNTPSSVPTEVSVRTVFTITAGSFDRVPLRNELSNQPDNAEFVVHLGNFVDRNCRKNTYTRFQNLLLSSNIEIPIFMIPGEKDMDIDCVGGDDKPKAKPIEEWENNFGEINSNWSNSFTYIERPSTSTDNLRGVFSIFHNSVLFIGLNLLSEDDWSAFDYANHLNLNLKWVQNQIHNRVVKDRGLRSLVFYGNQKYSGTNALFFTFIVDEIKRLNIPALYLYESDQIENFYPVGDELLFVGIESGYVPFTIVHVKTDGGKFGFQFILQ